MVLCNESGSHPSDCGTGVLRVNDSNGRAHQLEMMCRSPSSDCAQRPKVHERGFAGSAPVGGGVPAAGPGPAIRATAKTMGHFQWQLEVDTPGGGSPARNLSSRHGDIAAGDGWRCAYAITDQKAPNYFQLELGYTTCRSKGSSDAVETVLLCAESHKRPSACNMGSLRLRDTSGSLRSIVMSCKSPGNSCW